MPKTRQLIPSTASPQKNHKPTNQKSLQMPTLSFKEDVKIRDFSRD